MAALKKFLDKPTFALLVICVNALMSVFMTWLPIGDAGFAAKTAVVIIVNAVIVWLGTETQPVESVRVSA